MNRINNSNDARDLVKSMARIWRMYKKQESLFRLAMGLNTSSRLRRIFSKGYMMSLLFKKDVGSMYESLKSNLDDGELSSITRKDDTEMDEVENGELLSKICLQQQTLLEEYKTLMSRLDGDSEAARACDEHIEKLFNLENSLAREVEHLSDDETESYSSVA